MKTLSEESPKKQFLKPNKKRFQCKDIVFMTLLAIQIFTVFLGIGAVAPFFPSVAKDVGASFPEINFSYSILFLALLISSPVVSCLLPNFGPNVFYLGGGYLRCVSDFAFAFINRLSEKPSFLAVMFILQIISGVGEAAVLTAAYTLTSTEYPERSGLAVGIIQASSACGLMMGPPVGGLLYSLGKGTVVGSFSMPFICISISGFLVVSVNIIYLLCTDSGAHTGRSGDRDAEKPSTRLMLHLMGHSRISTNMCCVLVSYMVWIHIEISLARYLKQIHPAMSSTTLGFIFGLGATCYAVGSIFWGYVDDHWFYPTIQRSVSITTYIVSCLLLAPTPSISGLLGVSSSKTMVSVFLSLLGASASALNIASYKDMSRFVLNHLQMGNNLSTNGVIASLYMISFTTGAFIGPIVGGAIEESVGFEWALACLSVLLVLLYVPLILTRNAQNK